MSTNKRNNFTFELEEETDREFLKKAAKDAGVEKPSILMRGVIRVIKGMTPAELRDFLAAQNK